MGENFNRKIIKFGDSLAVTIPKEILEILKLKKGEMVKIEITKKK